MTTEFTIAYRCRHCGKIEFRHISIFELSGKKPLKVCCSNCENQPLVIKMKNYKNLIVNIDCVICKIPHIYHLSLRKILKDKDPIIFFCMTYELELCFVGEKSSVQNTVDKYEQDLEEFMDQLGYDDYFISSEIMMECINILHDLAEVDGIICNCRKDDIGITLLPDSIELRCQNCRGTYIIPAQNRQDVENLLNLNNIFIEEGNNISKHYD